MVDCGIEGLGTAVGAVIGAAATLAGQFGTHFLQTRDARKRNGKRTALLAEMLNNPGPTGWRSIDTMAGVIGASRDEAANLLVNMGARRNENAAGTDVWGWVKDHPLPQPKDVN